MVLIVAASAVFRLSSAALAAGPPGVPAAATVAASAVLILISEALLAASNLAAAAAGTPRQANLPPIMTLELPGPPVSTGGNGCATGSVIRAAGLPIGFTSITSVGDTSMGDFLCCVLKML